MDQLQAWIRMVAYHGSLTNYFERAIVKLDWALDWALDWTGLWIGLWAGLLTGFWTGLWTLGKFKNDREIKLRKKEKEKKSR